MKYISLFSGIEAASVAWKNFGWEPVAFSEIEEYQSAVLKTHFPEVPNLGDVSKIDWKEYKGQADLIVGGSPCQSFSQCGKRLGLLDARGRLMLEYVRAVKEVNPKWLLWENVPAVLSNDKGRSFGTLLKQLADLGYSLGWRVLDSSFFGVPQRRRRVFLIGYYRADRPGAPAAVFTEYDNLQRVHSSSVQIWEKDFTRICSKTAKRRSNKIRESWLLRGSDMNRSNKWYFEHLLRPKYECSNTIKAQGGKDYVLYTEERTGKFVLRKFTPLEIERLFGFPDNWTQIAFRGKPKEECPNNLRYFALGNSMVVPVMRWLGKRIQAVDNILEGS